MGERKRSAGEPTGRISLDRSKEVLESRDKGGGLNPSIENRRDDILLPGDQKSQ